MFNTGDSFLGTVQVTSDDLGFTGTIDGTIPPKESKILTYKTVIESTTNITASVEGNPTLDDGTDIPSAETVVASDPAGHRELQYSPSINIDNLVVIGNSGADSCGDARDYVEGPVRAKAWHNMIPTSLTFFCPKVWRIRYVLFPDNEHRGQLFGQHHH